MSIEIQCSKCGMQRQVNDRLSGRRVRCPECDAAIQVPEKVAEVFTEQAVVSNVLQPVGLTVENVHHKPAPIDAPLATHDTPRPDPPKVETAEDEDEPVPAKMKADEGELDMTPMVDVTFLLLIFFMITAAFSLQKSIESPRQQSDKPSSSAKEEVPEEVDSVTVQIDERGSFLVLAADWERETPGKQNLIAALKEANTGGEIKLAIEVHEQAKLQALVDCMDAGTLADYTNVQVTEVDGFE